MKDQYKILIAEDSPSMLATMHSMLADDEFAKYQIIKAYNGREACTEAFKHRPDLILIDIQMPVMNGPEAIAKIKSNEHLKDIPIIVISSTRLFHDAINAGANDFLLKPFNQFELLLRVQLNLKIRLNVAEIKRQQDIINNKKQEVIQQRGTVVRQKRDLMEDVYYASYIQNAILPESSLFGEYFSSYFIFYKPKNIISGDFYWITYKNDKIIIAVGDCTGHGISGALMTMAGAAFLNEIINSNNRYEADLILNDLRQKVMKLLHQKGKIGEAANGMDIALCVIDPAKKMIQYAGANNPVYIVHNNQPLTIYKADRMPIGVYITSGQSFKKEEIPYENGDVLYLFTDGYADQFGGDMGQKFRYNQFKDVLQKGCQMPMNEQLALLESTMDTWRGDYEQVDDMLVIGIKL